MRPLSDLQWQIIRMFGDLNVAMPPAAVSRQLGRTVKRTGRVMLKEYKMTNSQRVTIHRSLRSLVARGLMQVDERHRYSLTDVGLAVADAQTPGLAEERAAKTAEWERFREGLRQIAAALPRRRPRRTKAERALAANVLGYGTQNVSR